MSEENVQETNKPAGTEVVETEVVETKKTLDQLSQEELVEYVKTLRKENASHRTEKQAKAKELEEFRTWKDSQKTELQKVQERAESLEAERLSLLRTNAALAFGLDEDVAEFVKGDTEDEIKASAQKLAEKFGANQEALAQVAGKTGVTDVFAGNRGVPVNQKVDVKQAANDFMAQLIWGSGR